MLDNLQACAGHVISHNRIGTLCVGSRDRLNNLVMFVECVFGLAGHELKCSKRSKPLPKAPRDRCDACVVCALIDDFVEFIVQCRQIFGTIQNPLLSIEVHSFQPLLLQHGHTHRAELRAKRFEFSQRLEHVVKLADIDPRDCHSLSWGNLNKTCPAQSPKRFAYGRSRHAELSADAWLVEASARLRCSGQNVLDQRTKDFLRERHGLSTAWARRFHIRLRGQSKIQGRSDVRSLTRIRLADIVCKRRIWKMVHVSSSAPSAVL
jgi:hypothetical protein